MRTESTRTCKTLGSVSGARVLQKHDLCDQHFRNSANCMLFDCGFLFVCLFGFGGVCFSYSLVRVLLYIKEFNPFLVIFMLIYLQNFPLILTLYHFYPHDIFLLCRQTYSCLC